MSFIWAPGARDTGARKTDAPTRGELTALWERQTINHNRSSRREQCWDAGVTGAAGHMAGQKARAPNPGELPGAGDIET